MPHIWGLARFAVDVVVTPLGTRGWMPQSGRETMCTLVQMGPVNFLLDCGTGVTRLQEPEIRERLGEGPLNILFSHYHLDHFVGLTYLPGLSLGPERPVRLMGPRAGFTQFGLRTACERLTAPPFYSRSYKDFPFPLELHEFGPEGMVVEGIPIGAALQEHPGGSVCLRIGDAVCYATDLAASTPELSLASGVQVLIHEAWGLERQTGPHSGLLEALERAGKAGVPRVIPVHFNPEMTEARIKSISTFSTVSLQVIVPEEGRTVRIAPTIPAEECLIGF